MSALTKRNIGRRTFQWTTFLVAAIFFFLPLWAVLRFSFRDPFRHVVTTEYWRQVFVSSNGLVGPIRSSFELAGVTVIAMLVLLVPTAIWTHLRVPQMRRIIEFLCLLPLVIPALALAVGIKDVYSWVFYYLGHGPLTLTFIYVILVLPYAYRSIDTSLSALDLTTLAEAARSLGSGWWRIIVRIILPNIKSGILGAVFLSIALALGEYTFASLLVYKTLPTALVQVEQNAVGVAMAATFATILVIALLLVIISALDQRKIVRKGN